MRTIKFRLWNNAGENSRMFYDAEQVMECLKQQTLFNDISNKYHKLGFDHVGIGSSFMQFTGLTDKNGKEIYEGDILKVYKPNTWLKFDDFHVVKYHETQAKFAYWCVRIRDWTTSNTGLFNIGENQHGRWCEVIGNIYENPNLLK